MASTMFNKIYSLYEDIEECSDVPLFDARVFNLPKEEVANYFVWRQQDAIRNSINMLAQYHFPPAFLQGKNVDQVRDMLLADRGVDWNHLAVWKKHGTAIKREAKGWRHDSKTPIFTQDRDYINNILLPISD